jgi:hypothetical protein
MGHHSCTDEPQLKTGFSTLEKTLMQVSFYGVVLVGVLAIGQQSPPWAAGYSGFMVIGMLFFVGPGLCAHCPYPTYYGDCLFLPTGFVNRFYPYSGPVMNTFEKISITVVLLGTVLAPHPWLIKAPVWLIPFWVFALPFLLVTPVYYCRRCRHFGCPLNRVKGKIRKQSPLPAERISRPC